jgi:CHAT domain-containing protein/tetratricopeptide (TPR) repeat protein
MFIGFLPLFISVLMPFSLATQDPTIYKIVVELSKIPPGTDFDRMADLARQGLIIARRQGNLSAIANFRGLLGVALTHIETGDRSENLEIAIENFESALTYFDPSRDHDVWVDTHTYLATAYRERLKGVAAANIEKAVEHASTAARSVSYMKDAHRYALANIELGNAYADRLEGSQEINTESAIEHLEEAVQVLPPLISEYDWAVASHNLGILYSRRLRGDRNGNIVTARRYFKDALRYRTKDHHSREWAATTAELAEAYAETPGGTIADNMEEAIRLARDALTALDPVRDRLTWSRTRTDLCLFYMKRPAGEHADNLEQALVECSEGVKTADINFSPSQWARAHDRLGDVYVRRYAGGRTINLQKALDEYKVVSDHLRQGADPHERALGLVGAARAHLEYESQDPAGEARTALGLLRQASSILGTESAPEQWAIVENMTGVACMRLGQEAGFDEAIHHFQKALEFYTLDRTPIAWVHQYLNIVTATLQRHGKPTTEDLLAAERLLRDCLRLDSDILETGLQADIWQALGRVHAERREWVDSYADFSKAINYRESVFSRAYSDTGRREEVRDSAGLFIQAAEAAIHLGRLDEAVSKLEQGRTRLLIEVMDLQRALNERAPAEVRAEVATLYETISRLEYDMRSPADTPDRKTNAELGSELHKARDRMKALLAQHGMLRSEPKLNLAALSRSLPSGSAVVLLFITSRGVGAFLLPAGFSSVRAENLLYPSAMSVKQVEDLLNGSATRRGWLTSYERFRSAPTPESQQEWFEMIAAANVQIWDGFMGQVSARLERLGIQRSGRVILIPDGRLALLPLHSALSATSGQTFGDRFTVTYSPSLRVYLECQRRARESTRRGSTLLAISDPTGDLPFAELEGQMIAALFRTEARETIVGKRAMRADFLAASAKRQYIHFSGHGFSDWRDPLRSGLVLADQRLTVSEMLANTSFGVARLVTLSACETGISDFSDNLNEYVGLPAGFLQAGAPSVLSSLWAVNDRSTAFLMQRVYQLHLKQGISLPAALRRAQIWLRNATQGELRTALAEVTAKSTQDMRFGDGSERPYAHPFYWAAFTLAGE